MAVGSYAVLLNTEQYGITLHWFDLGFCLFWVGSG